MVGLIKDNLRRDMIKKSLLEKQDKKSIQGFTLIELLVVISIIGILATLLMANFNSMRERARDAERKSDLRNIKTALRMYYNDFNKYPDNDGNKIKGCEDGTVSCDWGTSFTITDKDPYMSVLPNDPLSDRTYVYHSPNDDDFTLEACLENKSDKNCGGDCTSDFGSGPPEGCIYTVQP